jgi:DNA-binding response OmpR family regulator
MMMPVMDGLSFIREYQKEGSAPIIALTARVDETDKILGLEMGADDYITKPFSPRELTARVRAVLRRGGGVAPESKLLRAGNLLLDEEAHSAKLNNTEIELTPMEYNLLVTLMSHPGRAFSRMELLEHAQGFAYDGYERTVDVHIKNLRKKIETDPSQPEYVLTVFGVGYRFRDRDRDER